MEIERQWGKAPGWFASQPRGARVRLWAWYRVKCDPKGEHFKPAKKTAAAFWGVL